MALEGLSFELVDTSNGQTLIEDVQAAFLRNLTSTLTGAFRTADDANSNVTTD